MTNIFIARHGQTEFNRTSRVQGRGVNKSLNQTGIQQAHSIAHYLKNEGITHIFSSSLKRSFETAEIIAQILQVPLQSYAELDEMDFGVIEGRSISEIADDLDRLHNAWKDGNTAYAIEEGESPDKVLERVLLCMNILLKKYRKQSVLFVLHGRLIRILLAHWLKYGLPAMHRIAHQNGALYHLRLGDDETIKPVFLNKTEHLTEAS